jgi:cytochrome c-type biogenesis protein CcmH/NrfG
MTEGLVPIPVPSPSLLRVPWRDPRSVSPENLTSYLAKLERACLDNPKSAELRTLLGITHAVNYDVYKSMDALEAACAIDPSNFWAQLKYSELHYRLRALSRAETETL